MYIKKTYSVCVGKVKNKNIECRCHRCIMSITVAKNVDLINIFHCDMCKLYICDICSQKHRIHKDKLKEVQ